MSTWNDIKCGFRSIANKVIVETDELAEDAALAIKKKTAEAHLSEAYEKLGRISYRLLADEDSAIRSNEELQAAAHEVDHYRHELNEIEAQIRRRKEQGTKTEN